MLFHVTCSPLPECFLPTFGWKSAMAFAPRSAWWEWRGYPVWGKMNPMGNGDLFPMIDSMDSKWVYVGLTFNVEVNQNNQIWISSTLW